VQHVRDISELTQRSFWKRWISKHRCFYKRYRLLSLYIMLFLCQLNILDLTNFLSFLLPHKLNAFSRLWHWMAYFVLMCHYKTAHSRFLGMSGCLNPGLNTCAIIMVCAVGAVHYGRNGHHVASLMHVDHTLPMWAFFDVYGSVQKIKLLGMIYRHANLPVSFHRPSSISMLMNIHSCSMPRPPHSHRWH